MRRSLALAIALALVALVMAGCPTDLLSWRDGPAGRVLAPFAVDQAADLCSCGHENVGSAAALVFMS